jgi:hypothetical protein
MNNDRLTILKGLADRPRLPPESMRTLESIKEHAASVKAFGSSKMLPFFFDFNTLNTAREVREHLASSSIGRLILNHN